MLIATHKLKKHKMIVLKRRYTVYVLKNQNSSEKIRSSRRVTDIYNLYFGKDFAVFALQFYLNPSINHPLLGTITYTLIDDIERLDIFRTASDLSHHLYLLIQYINAKSYRFCLQLY
uniref:Uncharacterized protein n=1 Tax=Rhizophagus irregularis (strain DAOM 181602 / DAOM 197198 / MUCL 43194) TaxID=747089 RepID=U9SRN0_RHIID